MRFLHFWNLIHFYRELQRKFDFGTSKESLTVVKNHRNKDLQGEQEYPTTLDEVSMKEVGTGNHVTHHHSLSYQNTDIKESNRESLLESASEQYYDKHETVLNNSPSSIKRLISHNNYENLNDLKSRERQLKQL